jgi:hypothetical protein
MKTLLLLIAIMSLSVVCAACGDASNQARSVSETRSTSGVASTARPPSLSTSGASSATTSTGSLLIDEDDDDIAKDLRPPSGTAEADADADFDNDYKKQGGYYDRDDGGVRAYGHAAGAAQKGALADLAKRYYAAAATGNGVAACSMLTSTYAKSVAEDYGHGSAGEPYLRAGNTCSEVMALLFQHWHIQLTAPIEVILVRVKGNEALMLVGSKVLPARDLVAQHEADGGWRLVGLLGITLP